MNLKAASNIWLKEKLKKHKITLKRFPAGSDNNKRYATLVEQLESEINNRK